MKDEANGNLRTPRPWRWSSLAGLALIIAALMALGLHVQPTVPIFGSEIRLSLSDLLAPLLLPFAIWVLIEHRSRIGWALPYILAGIAASTIVFCYGFFIGIARSGDVAPWAMVKFIGWFVLLYYLALGALLAIANPERAAQIFTLTFFAVHALLLLSHLLYIWAGIGLFELVHFRMTGLFENPNAYSLALICSIVLMLALKRNLSGVMRWYWYEASLGLLFIGMIFSSSIAAVLSLCIVLFLYLAIRGGVLSLARSLSAALLVIFVSSGLPTSLSKLQLGSATEGAQDTDRSDVLKNFRSSGPDKLALRLESSKVAISLWKDSPVFGIGLGAYMASSDAPLDPHNEVIQIHNSALWLLTEFGLVGVVVFSGLIIGFLVWFARTMGRVGDRDPPVADAMLAGILLLAGWITMSVAHELMYQRVPWFILGLCAGYAVLSYRPTSPDTR